MPVPAPLAATGEVLVDPFARTLNVRPAEMSGYAAVLWRQAHRERQRHPPANFSLGRESEVAEGETQHSGATTIAAATTEVAAASRGPAAELATAPPPGSSNRLSASVIADTRAPIATHIPVRSVLYPVARNG